MRSECRSQFLTRDVKRRLGCTESGPSDIKKTPFFKILDFAKLERQEIMPPYVPEIKYREANNFDKEITDAKPELPRNQLTVGTPLNQAAFSGFTFVGKR